MRKITSSSQVNRHIGAAELVRHVAISAPVSSEHNNAPVVHAFIEESAAIRGYTVVAETLSDETSALLELPNTSKDRAQDTLTYLRQSLQSRGINTDIQSDRMVQLRKSRLN